MGNGRQTETETEIKLATTPAMLEALAAHPLLAGEAPEAVQQLESRYFDTADGALARHRVALRLRRTARGLEQTLKLPRSAGESVCRGEWNVDADGLDCPDPARFPAGPGARLAAMIAGKALVPVVATRVARRSRRLRHGASLIEADFDFGRLEGGGRSEAVCELELELVEGEVTDLFRLALELPLGPQLGWSLASKSERARALAAGLAPAAVQARPLALGPDALTGAALAAIARECLDQVLGNYRLVVASGLPEAVHQTRVAIRRLRAIFSLYRRVIGPDWRARFAERWKTAAAALGPARDAQVLLAGIAARAPAGEEASALLGHLAQRRDAATRAAQDALASAQFQRLLFEFAIWIEEGMVVPDKAGRPFRHVTRRMLARRQRRLAKSAARLRKLDEEELHELRIDVKKLRYATEFTESLFPEVADKVRRRARHLRAVQDLLGAITDLATAARDRAALFAGLAPEEGQRLAARLAALEEHRHAGRAQLLRRASRKLERIVAEPDWWAAD